MYWKDGLFTRHEQGILKIESVKIPQGNNKPLLNGVMVSVHDQNEDYALMGMVVDELDDLINDHYPGTVHQ